MLETDGDGVPDTVPPALGDALGPVVRAFVPGAVLLVGRVREGHLQVAGAAGFPGPVPRHLPLLSGAGTPFTGSPRVVALASEPPSPLRACLEAAGMAHLLWVPLDRAGGKPGDVVLLASAAPPPEVPAASSLAAVGALSLRYLRRRGARPRPGGRLGAILCDGEGTVQALDRPARQILGLRGDGREPVGRHIGGLLGGGLAVDVAACAEGASPRRRSLPGVHGGRCLTVSLHRMEGRVDPAPVVVVLRDAGRLRLRRDDGARRHLAALGQLAAGAAHEIRNPLAAVRGFVQLVSAQMQDQEQAHYLRIVDHEIDRIDRLTRDILLLSRADDDARVACDMAEVVAAVAQLTRRQAELVGVRLQVRLDPDLPAVPADRFRLEQVLLNLVHNALDVTPAGGCVEVTARARPGWVDVAVEDAGPGVSPAVLSRIFEPFFTTKPGGTGLGLAVTQSIVRGLGGDIEVASRPGHGSTFTVRLPTRAPV